MEGELTSFFRFSPLIPNDSPSRRCLYHLRLSPRQASMRRRRAQLLPILLPQSTAPRHWTTRLRDK
jgi:hypothetical protein